MKPKIKLFSASTLQEMFDSAKREGYRIATLKETYNLTKGGKVKNRWYDTSTIYIRGVVRTAEPWELTDLRSIYSKGARVIFLDYMNGGMGGNWLLGGVGLGVGVLIRRKK